MKVAVIQFACDIPGCENIFSFANDDQPARVWREAKRVGWNMSQIREAVDMTGRHTVILVDPWNPKAGKTGYHACPDHSPRGHRGLVVYVESADAVELPKATREEAGTLPCRGDNCGRTFGHNAHRVRHETAKHPELAAQYANGMATFE